MNQDVEAYYRKVKERRHRPSGTVLYGVAWGAKDDKDVPKFPGNEDGHGHRIYLLLNGEEHTLIERQPDMENRKLATKEQDEKEWEEAMNAPILKEIEEARETKLSLVKRAEALARQGEAEEGLSMDEMAAKFNEVKTYGLEWEGEYASRMQIAKDRYEKKKEEWDRHQASKEELIRETEEFAQNGVFYHSDKILKEQMERWKQIGSAGAAADEALWERFHEIRQDIYQKKKAFFDGLKEEREQNSVRKRELIEAAKEATAEVANYRDASVRLNEIFDLWKETGSAGRSADEKLWEEFNGIRSDFKEKRKAYYDDLHKDQGEAVVKKENILKEAREIAEQHDYSKENSERMKELNVEWKQAGSAGHETDNRLWNEYRAVQDSFWEGKHEEHAAARKEYTDKLESAIEKKQAQIENLKNQIYHLKDKMHSVQNPGYLINMGGWVQEKEAAIKELREQIERMNKRL